MSLLIKGGKILTMDRDEIIDNGEVLIENKTITYVGLDSGVETNDVDVVIQAAGKYVLPGFVNMHCHTFQVFLRTLGADLDLLQWLQKVIWPVVHRYKHSDSLAAARLAFAENIRSGVTCVVDMNYGNPNHEAVLEAFESMRIRGYVARGFYEVECQDHLQEKYDKILKDLQRLFEKYPNTLPGPMHPYNVTNDLLKATKELAKQYHRSFYTHLAESEEDVQLLMAREGKRDAELLHDLDIIDGSFIGVHACNLNKQEIDYLGEARATTVHCPTTNMNIADGVSPISELVDVGVNVCIGTDGAASTGRLDMFSEMKTTALLQKVHRMNPAIISAATILKMATVNGSTALGIKSGRIKKGFLADIVILDMTQANTVFSHDPYAAVVYSANTNNVDTVVVNGEILLQNKKFTTIDENKVLQEGLAAAPRITPS
jgi:5-methylthioadenosine/S-adenosylhomocysteine deaminase